MRVEGKGKRGRSEGKGRRGREVRTGGRLGNKERKKSEGVESGGGGDWVGRGR